MGDSPKKCKSILKSSSSFDKHDTSAKRTRNTKWDEMNILETYHPANKDYGHMKIDEPKTPYHYDSNADEVDQGNKILDPELLHAKLIGVASSSRKRESISEVESDDDEKHLDEAEKLRRKEFSTRRKIHYDEFKAAQIAKMLMAEEEDDDDDEEDSKKADPV